MKSFFIKIKNWACDFFPSLWNLFKHNIWAQIMVGVIVLITILLTIREINYDKWYGDDKSKATLLLEELDRRDSLKNMGIELPPMDWEKYK